jgi:peptidoglycan hydrolase-like protein with peptidoglycan-binding domain
MNIKRVQGKLNAEGFGPIEMDGELGPKTRAAVIKFQIAKGFPANGTLTGPQLDDLLKTGQPTATTLNLRALQIAESQEGVKEATGKNDGPIVEGYLKEVGLGAGFSWCMAFVVWCYSQAAAQLGAKNPLNKTGGVLDQWNHTACRKITPSQIDNFQPGDIFILDLGLGHGHTGMIISKINDGEVATVEGNTNDNGSANGDGVYIRSRHISSFAGIIRP